MDQSTKSRLAAYFETHPDKDKVYLAGGRIFHDRGSADSYATDTVCYTRTEVAAMTKPAKPDIKDDSAAKIKPAKGDAKDDGEANKEAQSEDNEAGDEGNSDDGDEQSKKEED